MADDLYAGFTVGSKPLSSLRVIDLKSELEKRGLSKSGSKKDLQERLKRQLQLERLQESAQHNADRVPNLSLRDDAIGTQNEVVKQYLAAQQKTYELQKEARRQIELSADEVGVSDTDASSSQDEGLSPLKSSARSHRARQTVKELKESEVVSSELEEAEDLSKDSENTSTNLRSQLLPKNENIAESDKVKQSEPTDIVDTPKDLSKSSEIPVIETIQSEEHKDVEQAENLTVKLQETSVLEDIKPVTEVIKPIVEDKADIAEQNRLVNITESEMAVAIESISAITPSFNMDVAEDLAMSHSNVESVNEEQPSEEQVTKSPVQVKPPVKDEIVNKPCEPMEIDKEIVSSTEKTEVNKSKDTSQQSPQSSAVDMVKDNKMIGTRVKSEIKEDSIKLENPHTTTESDSVKKKAKSETSAEQPMDLSREEGLKKIEPKSNENKEESLKKENVNGSSCKTEITTEVKAPVKEKPGSDTENESQSSEKHSRSRSVSSDSRSSSASFHSESGSCSSLRGRGRKKRIRNTDSEASSSSDESEVKTRSKVHVSPAKEVKSEGDKEAPLAGKRRKWTNTSAEPNIPIERRKINRSNNVAVIENKEKEVKVENEEIEDPSDKKDTLVLDLHATDEAMGVSDTEKETEPKPDEKKLHVDKIEDAEPEKTSEKVKKITNRKILISGSTSKEEDNTKPQRKRKWGSLSKVVPVSSPVISTESLKGLIPDLTPALSAATKMEDIVVKTPVVADNLSNSLHSTNKIEIDDKENEFGHPREVSPPRKPVSSILYVRNLVRPFTLNQLKEVLGKTGVLVDDCFWIDKIKSKCYVTYETEDQAVETRKALHGTRWPASNPKTLFVDFSTTEELEFHKGGAKPPPAPPVKVETPKEHYHSRESSRKVSESSASADKPRRPSASKDDKKHADRSGAKSRSGENSNHPVREWDRDKIVQDDNRRFRDRDRTERSGRSRDNDKSRSKERKDRKDKKVDIKKKQEVETPGKLLDDLFRKTKAMPCIYWLPLTDQQIVQRDELRKTRMLEREKRRQRIELEDKERVEAERKNRLKEREARMARDRNTNRRSRSMSRSPVRRR